MRDSVSNTSSALPPNPASINGGVLGTFGGESSGFAQGVLHEVTKNFYGKRAVADAFTVAKGMDAPIPRSIFNEYALFNFRGMYGGLTGKSGDDFRMDEDDPSNKPFIPFTNICNNTYIKGSDLKLVSINEDDNQNRVEKDDLFFMMTSETQEDVGKTSVLKEDLGEVYLNTFCKGFRITDNSVNPYFLNYLLNGKPYRELLSVEGNGFTRINLRQDRVNDFVLFTPSLPEQEQIVSFLDGKTGEIDSTIDSEKKKIDLLKEYRQSLISSVITGKIKVVD